MFGKLMNRYFYGKSGQGDFEKERFEGEVSAKGRIRMGSLAALTIKLVFTKPIREFIFRFLKVRGELL